MNIKQFHRSVWGLDKVLFAERTPLPEYRKIVFAERTEELERAEMLLIDTPRNLLVGGLFGVGKTIFLQELMRYLQEQYPEDVLTVYECLDSTEADLLTTILRALARALKAEDEEAARIDQLLSGIEIVSCNCRREACVLRTRQDLESARQRH